MLGILNDFSGEINLFWFDIRQDKKMLQRIATKKSVEQAFPATVSEIVSLGMIGRKINRESIDSAIEFVELEHIETRE